MPTILVPSTLVSAHHCSCRILAAGRETAEAFKRLLELIHQTVQKPTAENKGKLIPYSKEVADNVKELVAAAEAIRGACVCVHACVCVRACVCVCVCV